MLEGLDICIQNYQDLKDDHRIDPEFYQKKYVAVKEALDEIKTIQLDDLGNLYDGPFGSAYHSDNYEEQGIPMLRMQNISKEGLFLENNLEYVNEDDAKSLTKHEAFPGEVVTTKIGFLGYSTVLPKDYDKYLFRRELTRVKIHKKELINPYYLATFLNTRFGRNQFYRYSSGTTRDRVLLTNQRNTEIPILSESFQERISTLVKKAYSSYGSSKQIYQEAQKILNDNFGDFKHHEESNKNIKNFSDSFLKSGRLDAEYYQPKYEQVVDEIKSKPHGRLEDVTDIIKSLEPGTANYGENGIPFIRVADFDKFGIEKPEVCITKDYCQENPKKVKELLFKKDTVLLSKDGSVGIAYNIKEDRKMLTSSAILHLKINEKENLLPEYLALVLNSKLTQMQAERDGGGSIIVHWRLSDVRDVLIPILSFEKQKEINDLVVQSFELKAKSEKLLEIAKRAVEVAIEEDEEVASKYIEDETGDLEISEYAIG